jgi:molybdate transport system permease protein
VGGLLPTPAEAAVLWLSVKVGLAGVALLAVPATGLAWLLARRRFPGKAVLDVAVHAPLVLPPVVTGYALLLAFGSHGPLGALLHRHLGLDVAFTWRAAALASAVMGLPLMVRSVRLAFELVDPRLEQAARTLGASPLEVFRRVLVPLAAPGFFAGFLLAFARSLGEFGATITFAGNIQGETRTLPLAIYTALQLPGGDHAALRLVLLSSAISVGALAASEILAARSRRRLGTADHA